MTIQAMPFVPGEVSGVLRRRRRDGEADCILLLHFEDLLPLETPPAGLIVVGGAPLSHPMTELQGLGIPTVIVSRRQAESLREGERLWLDGISGRIGVGELDPVPVDEQRSHDPGRPFATADDVAVELRASITGVQGAQDAHAVGATAVGMVRTEYLVPSHGRMPDQAFYQKAFRAICEAAVPLPVTFRLLDISVDKKPPWLGELSGMTGLLGMQGSRLFGVRPVSSLVSAQAAALANVSRDHPLRVLVPYVASPEEFRHWRNRLRAWLPDRVPIGPMVETPAAALAMPEWQGTADFVSVGCNDLMQCLFGADRDIPDVAGYLDPYAPTLLRFFDLIARAAGDEGMARLQLCGLLMQMPGVLPLLLGLGFRRFSMAPRLIPAMSRVLARTRLAEAEQLAATVLAAGDSGSVRDLLGMSPESRPPMPWNRVG